MDPASIIHCVDTVPTLWGIFSLEVPPALLFFAYIPISLMALFLGVVVFYNDKYSPRSQLLLLLSILFAFFLANEIALWTATPAGIIYFSWSISLLLRAALFSTAVLFLYVFTYGRYPPFTTLLLGSFLLFPLTLFLPTQLNVLEIDIVNCVGIDGPLWIYLYVLEVTTIITVLVWAIRVRRRHRQSPSTDAIGARFLLFAAAAFLSTLFASEFIGEMSGLYEINLFGPIGMLIFIASIAYLIAKYQAFSMKPLITEMLALVILALFGSQLFFAKSTLNYTLTIITLVLSSIASYFLVRSVRKEVLQRLEIQKLAENLERANTRLAALDKKKSEFVSIASHQLRSPLAAIMGYASMLRDGSFGKLPQKAVEATERIEQSAKLMASSVEDYLNVSRIESGTMKYNPTDFNLRDEVEHICDDLRNDALNRGVVVYFKQKLGSTGVVHADIGKTQQIIHNLINNAIKYTPKGSVTVTVHDNIRKKRIFVDIDDTGIGMSKNTLDTIFQKFERGDNANVVNVKGTGLGLYTAYKLAEAMKGGISATSAGEGKGSRFTFELPLML